MKNLYQPATAAEVQARLQTLRPDSARQWGTMNPAQAVAHCAASMETAVGDTLPGRVLIGRIIGWLIKPLVLGNEEPMRRNTPTSPEMRVADERDLERERQRLARLIDRFATGGPSACTTHPHSFFGRLTPQEWAVLMYKHLDHHLRQFGA
ncbi:MAG TPA: DUF1569 domain-containing protein [Longimicrobium sp.]|jgi:hypothetical protein|uniref:DUF1569 domain-containing protein n=1 Tax=Longimicrobium sp. TaxID=2029185 RepID=UPI002ED93A09